MFLLQVSRLPALLCGASFLLFTACGSGPTPAGSRQYDTAQAAVPHHATAGHNTMTQSMNAMMEKMHRAPMTGDPDRDFAEMMIIHHEGAIDMARAELAAGKDSVIRRMAAAIIAAQQAEVARMRSIAAALPAAAPAKPAAGEDPLMASMSGMMEAGHSLAMTGNADQDFVRMMIPHHEGAVRMAEVQLRQGRNAALKALAQQMIDGQTAEITRFRQWLAAQPR